MGRVLARSAHSVLIRGGGNPLVADDIVWRAKSPDVWHWGKVASTASNLLTSAPGLAKVMDFYGRSALDPGVRRNRLSTTYCCIPATTMEMEVMGLGDPT